MYNSNLNRSEMYPISKQKANFWRCHKSIFKKRHIELFCICFDGEISWMRFSLQKGNINNHKISKYFSLGKPWHSFLCTYAISVEKTKAYTDFSNESCFYNKPLALPVYFTIWLIASSSSCSLKSKGPHRGALVFTFLAKYAMLMSTDGVLKCSWLNIKAKCLQINRWR